MTGLPPFDLDVPIVFDYLDCAEWGSDSPDEKPYLDQADLVLAVSSLAEEQARRFHDRVVFLPNGADVERIREASGEGVRCRHNLGDAKVLSLIGLMDSPYFLEAVLNAQESIPDLKCILVGESDSIRRALSKMEAPHDTFVDVGSIPYTEVPSYLAASDVGVYPVPGTSYDDGRSPIKIFEYTAAGCPVVAPPIKEVKRLDFANLILASPTAEDFASAIVEAFHTSVTTEPAIEQYSWRRIASRLNRHLTRLCIEMN
jgi:glycosyltransferase involved in cell wall biosynthesis